MEIPTATNSVIESYAKTVNALADALGSDVRTISLVTPNGGEFYSPESMHQGLNSQKDMIDYCYGKMGKRHPDRRRLLESCARIRTSIFSSGLTTTGRSWAHITPTLRSARRQALRQCRSTGLRPDATTGSSARCTPSRQIIPQSQTLLDNPDYLEYYLPIATTHAKYYADGNLQNGVPVSVVYQHLDASVSNKYQCFIGGDTPVCVIETDVEGPVCLMLKGVLRQRLCTVPDEPLQQDHRRRPQRVQPRRKAESGPDAVCKGPGREWICW